MEWALADPFVIDIRVADEAIDAYQHVNNSEYLRWVEQISWAHSEALGPLLSVTESLIGPWWFTAMSWTTWRPPLQTMRYS